MYLIKYHEYTYRAEWFNIKSTCSYHIIVNGCGKWSYSIKMSIKLNSIFFHVCQKSLDSRYLFLFWCVIETWGPSSDKFISNPERAMRKKIQLEQDRQKKKRSKTNYQQFISHFSSWQTDFMLWIINCWLLDYVSIPWNKLRPVRKEMIT